MNLDKLAEAILKEIAKLEKQKKEIDDRIAALYLAHDTLAGQSPKRAAPVIKQKKDPKGLENTLAWMQGRKRPVNAAAVAGEFGCTVGAAQNRLQRMTKLGWLERLSRGRYVAKEKAKAE